LSSKDYDIVQKALFKTENYDCYWVFLNKGPKYAMILNPSFFFSKLQNFNGSHKSEIFLVCVLHRIFALFFLENERMFGFFWLFF